jgi:membrane associated rhomboid family serine protease
MQYGQPQFHLPRVSRFVKAFIIVAAICFLLQLIFETAMRLQLSEYIGFVPARLAMGFVWQPFTYVLLHSGIFHLLFNLLVIWSMGSELEDRWGSAFFIFYFFVCALGGAAVYGIFSILGWGTSPWVPVIGSSAAVYGLLMAYGILFGDRPLYFFMLFPMPARYFVLILGAIELVSSVFYSRNGVAHTAHLGGMVTGFFTLIAMAKWRARKKETDVESLQRQKRLKNASHLKLVAGEEDDDPKHWH